MLFSHLCDKKKIKKKANSAETKQQQLSAVRPSKHEGEHIRDRGHQALQTNKLQTHIQQLV